MYSLSDGAMRDGATGAKATVPSVSVLMPVHNGEAHVLTAVESILAQSFTDFEFIIVDDGSTDATSTLLAEIADARVRVITNARNLGVTRALNVGLKATRGRYIARIDADDVAHPERLARQVAYMDAHPDVVLAGTGYVSVDPSGNVVEFVNRPMDDAEFRWTLLLHSPVIHPTVMFRGELVRDAGLSYDETIPIAQDHELWVRILDRGRGVRLGEPLLRWHRGSAAIGVAKRDMQLAVTTSIAHGYLERLFPDLAAYRLGVARLVAIHGGDNPQPITLGEAEDCRAAVDGLLDGFFRRYAASLTNADRLAVRQNATRLLFQTMLLKGGLSRRRLSAVRFVLRCWRYLPAAAGLMVRRLLRKRRPEAAAVADDFNRLWPAGR